MQHFHKQQFGTRLLALGLSMGLVLGSLTGCGNQEQDTGSSDTLVTSRDSASAGVTEYHHFFPCLRVRRSLPFLSSRSTAFPMTLPWYGRFAVLALENSGVKYYNLMGKTECFYDTGTGRCKLYPSPCLE